MSDSIPEELHRAWEFLNSGEEEKGLDIVLKYEKKIGDSELHYFEIQKVKLFLLLRCGKADDSKILAELTNKKAIKAENYFMGIYSNVVEFYSIFQTGVIADISKYVERCVELLKQISDKNTELYALGEFFTNFLKGHSFLFQYKFNNAEKLLKKNLIYLKNQPHFTFLIPTVQMFLGTMYNIRGELDTALKFLKMSHQNLKGNGFVSNMLRVMSLFGLGYLYTRRAEYNQALQVFKQSLALSMEKKINYLVADAYFNVINGYIKMGLIDQARIIFTQMEESEHVLRNEEYNNTFKLTKAVLLKESGRFNDLAKAIEIYREIDPNINASYALCELLLKELRITGDPEILIELESILENLINLGEKTKSYTILSHVYLFQAQIALIQMKIKESKLLLTKAQKIAADHGLTMLAQMISNTHDKILDQEEMWLQLKKSNAPISERLKLSTIEETLDSITEKKGFNPPKLETEQPVLLAAISNEGNLTFSIPFSSEILINGSKISQFVKSFTSLSDELFSESVERIKIGDNTMLLVNLKSFSVCYLFRGQSYNANIKLSNFIEALKENREILTLLNESVQKNKNINVNDHPNFLNLITAYFISDKKEFELPFKAYTGKDPFIFVSYAHSNKLQVYPIMDYLDQLGFNIWYDEGISISEDWKKSIVKNIEKCTVFLVFISPQIIDSEYVKKEISFALSRKKPFYSVYLKETKLPAELEFDMAGIQSMKKYVIHDNVFYEKLKENLTLILRKNQKIE